MSTLMIVVPETRDRCGRASVIAIDGSTVLGPFRILATASRRVAQRHGNPDGSRVLPFGDPPAGRYVIARTLPPGTRHRRPVRFGGLGAFVLQPAGGEPTEGQHPVVLHGGPKDRHGRLRRTRGGLRIADGDLAKLVVAINARQAVGDPVSAVELIDVSWPELAGDIDRPGGRHHLGGSRGPSHAISRGLALPAILLAASLPRSQDPGLFSRRAFLKSSLLLLGSLGAASACSDTPGNCDPGGATVMSDGGVPASASMADGGFESCDTGAG